MSSPKLALVVGPESSGTRLLTRLLIRAGCDGSAEHAQPFDQQRPTPNGTPVVWRRSYPHGGAWPDLPGLVKDAKAAGFEPVVLAIVRDSEATARSQVAAPHAESYEAALDSIAEAVRRIVNDVHKAKVPWRLVTYAGLFSDPYGTLSWISAWIGLDPVLGEDITNGNTKYFERAPGPDWR